jgi:hypothetical protein
MCSLIKVFIVIFGYILLKDESNTLIFAFNMGFVLDPIGFGLCKNCQYFFNVDFSFIFK